VWRCNVDQSGGGAGAGSGWGGGGGGGAGAEGAEGAGGGGAGWLHDDDIWGQIEGLMSGGTSAFDDDTLNRMYGELHQATQGRTRAAGREIQLDALRRGMTRSGMVTDATAGVQRAALSEYTGGVRKILIEKAKSDITLKVQGIQMAQAWLGQRREYILGLKGISAQKELGMAQVRLGYARIQAEIRMTQMQISAMGSGGGGGPDEDWTMLSGLLGQALAA